MDERRHPPRQLLHDGPRGTPPSEVARTGVEDENMSRESKLSTQLPLKLAIDLDGGTDATVGECMEEQTWFGGSASAGGVDKHFEDGDHRPRVEVHIRREVDVRQGTLGDENARRGKQGVVVVHVFGNVFFAGAHP